jgi:hypothetical protein
MIDLTENNSRLNHCGVDGIFTMQHRDILKALLQANISVDNVFEIGTNGGGFTRILREVFPKANILTIDIQDLGEKKLSNVQYLIGDCFASTALISALKSVVGSKAIFCDGGNKPKEFTYFAEYLNKGDHILLHDYIKTKEEFREKYQFKIWNWHGACYEKIQHTCELHGLEPFAEHLLREVVWGSFYKLRDSVSL